MTETATWISEELKSDFITKLGVFEGPLDLLLYLIKKNEIDLNNIKLELITNQYIEYMELMQQMNIDLASEFVVTASTLLYLKTKWILPNDTQSSSEDDDLEDPRLDLIEKLLEYKKFKEASDTFETLLEKENSSIPRGGSDRELFEKEASIIKSNIFDLQKAFLKALKNKKDTSIEEVFAENFTVKQKISHILEELQTCDEILFSQLLEKASAKDEVICIFLGILELIKMQEIVIEQDGRIFGEIRIRKKKTTRVNTINNMV